MKYKVGDEVLVKCRINYVDNDVSLPYKVSRAGCISGFSKPLYILAGDDDIETMTAEEAWEIARRIILPERCGGLSSKEIRHIFGDVDVEDIIKDFSPQQVKAKIEAWEAENGIKVGDVVIETSDAGNEYIGVVTQITSAQNSVCIVNADGSTNITLAKKLKKTGRHIDIEGILKQIGGMSDENIKEKN